MSSTAAASGFVVFLLSVQVIQSEDGWGVTYTPTEVCAVEGSTVEIHCNYTYPSRIQHSDIKEAFWFKQKGGEPVDLKTDSEYSGRVQYRCYVKKCTLTITNLRKNDSAVYKFRFGRNQPREKYTGSPGVTLSVTDPGLQVKVIRYDLTRSLLECNSSYVLPDNPSYIWYKNGQHIKTGPSSYYANFGSADSYSCAVRGSENHCSPPVYAPKLPSVSVSPSGEIVEGSSVTLTCSSDANPAANYTWYKDNQSRPRGEEGIYRLTSISSEDRGIYYCKSENQHGWIDSSSLVIDVKYAPKLPSVSVSPSDEIVEGSSVTLTCSSDANPAANYTWYKEGEDSPKASGQIFTITDIRAEHSGNYYCEAQNNRGRSNSTLHLITVAVLDRTSMIIHYTRWTLVVLMPIPLLLFCLWMRKKKALSSTTEPHEPIEPVELDLCPVYENISAIAAQTEDEEEQEDTV
ncbi:B-cell receptor CD22-like [Anoplopoma fimbria]|uniref:B-cell receptor CD22-like n=1 Tax=Anoplopoma fimbria TaxID=229290 RepID=UPI0023EC593F|nr:B-cell receptor CD22-like [Anoplopoma fimbria]